MDFNTAKKIAAEHAPDLIVVEGSASHINVYKSAGGTPFSIMLPFAKGIEPIPFRAAIPEEKDEHGTVTRNAVPERAAVSAEEQVAFAERRTLCDALDAAMTHLM